VGVLGGQAAGEWAKGGEGVSPKEPSRHRRESAGVAPWELEPEGWRHGR